MKQPSIKFINNREVKLTKDFKVSWKLGKDKFVILIKKGFVTDGCSIPKAFWGFPFGFRPFEGDTLASAVVHDYFYLNQNVSRKFADDSFFVLLKQYKVPFIKRLAYWWAVRTFGKYE